MPWIIKLAPLGGSPPLETAADEHEGLVGFDFVGLADDQPVLPDGAIDFVGGPPGLRFEVDDIGRVAFAFVGADDFPVVGVVGRGNVVVERRAGWQLVFGRGPFGKTEIAMESRNRSVSVVSRLMRYLDW